MTADTTPPPPSDAPPPPPPGYVPQSNGAPAQTPAPASAPDTRPKTLAIIALVLAAVGFVMAFIPFVNWVAGLVLLAAFILSLIALIGAKHGGKGLSITALVISVVGWIVALVMIAVSFLWIGGAILSQAAQNQVTEQPAAPEDDDPPEDVAADDIAVLEGSFGQYVSDPSAWWYVVVIDNPNADYIFDGASLDVEALGADGTVLDTSSEYRIVLAGEAALVGDFYEIGDAEIVDLNLVGPTAADAVYSPFDETGQFALADLTATSDEFTTTVTGTVSGDFAEDLEYVQVTVVARDAAGQIIGGAWTYVDLLPADGTAVPFEAVFWDALPEGTTFEAYASL